MQWYNLLTFSGGTAVRIISRVKGSWIDREQVLQRALRLLGTPYDLLKFNCQHAAYYTQTGIAKSPQLLLAFGLAVLAAVVGLANAE